MDIVSSQKRAQMMAGIRSKNTKPELKVRAAAHAMGLRFRLHRKDLPGSPDLTFPRHGIAVFVHGCFWHQHHGCKLAAIPKTRTEFWVSKFARNKTRDRLAVERLQALGWRVETVWECETVDGAMLAERLRTIFGRP